MKNRSKNNQNQNINYNRWTKFTLFGILVLVFLSTILKDKMGFIGIFVSKSTFVLFGLAAYILPLYIIFMYFALKNKKFWDNYSNKVIVLSLVLLNLIIFMATFYNSGVNYNDMISKSYHQALVYTGTGIIFTSIYYLINALISDIGIYVFTSIIFFISYFYFFNKSIKEFFKSIFVFIFNKIKNLLSKDKENNEIVKKYNKNEKLKVNLRNNQTKELEKEIKLEPTISYYDSNENDKPKTYNQIGLVYEDDYEYVKPPIDILNNVVEGHKDDESILLKNAKLITETLESFGISSEVVNINNGPTVTSYEVKPQSGIKVSKIVNLSNNLAMALASPGIRIEAPIPGKPYVGIEVPNVNKDIVTFKSLVSTEEFQKENDDITVVIGKDLFGKPLYANINAMPHLLVAGATGSGKSVLMNSIIMSIIYKYGPKDVEFIMIDPKMVELKVYSGIPHLKGRKVVTKATEATASLHAAVKEMTSRYEIFSETGCRDIKAYNAKVAELDGDDENKLEKIPYLLVIIDELSDLMMEASKDVENYITRIAQMGRASGVHLIIATQRPSVNVITGIIKANVPSRIAFQVASNVDSRTIIDISGAEKLLGKGDMLYYPSQLPKPKRAQGAFVTDKEVERVVSFIKSKNKEIKTDNDFNKEIENINKPVDPIEDVDELFDQAVEFVLKENQASISAIQRRFRVGYARAGRIIDQMTHRGIISEQDGSKPRNVLMTFEEINEMNNEESND